MQWEEFVEWTDATAVYPEAGTGSTQELAYIALGLVGELGEIVQALGDPNPTQAVQTEFGDLFWYLARAARVLVPFGPADPVDAEQIDGSELMLVCNLTKKLLRDGREPALLERLSAQYAQAFVSALMLFYGLCPDALFEETLDEVVRKLETRKEAGTLHGSGDDR